MVLPYISFDDYCRTKAIKLSSLDDKAKADIRRFLVEASREVDGTTRRWYHPRRMIRRYSIPSRYVDLRQRAFVRDDLELDQDLLEPVKVSIGINNDVIGTGETLASPLTARATTFTMSDVDGLDSIGGRRVQAGDILRFEDEDCPVQAVNDSTNVVTIQRGAFETQAVAHAAGVSVQKFALLVLKPGIDFHLLDFNVRPAYAIRIVWPSTWAGRFTGASWRFRYPQIFVDGYWGYHEAGYTWWLDTTGTVQSGGLTAGAAEMELADAAAYDESGQLAWRDGGLYRIDNELIWGGTVSSTTTPPTQAITRGRYGTLAEAHEEGTPIYRFNTLEDVAECTLDIAKTLREIDQSAAGRQGVSDMSVGVKMGYSEPTTRKLSRLMRSIL